MRRGERESGRRGEKRIKIKGKRQKITERSELYEVKKTKSPQA